MSKIIGKLVLILVTAWSLGLSNAADATLTHDVTLAPNQSWCSDSMINSLFAQVNALRTQNGLASLTMSPLGMKDADLRASQFATYMRMTSPGSPGFNPHQGYDTTAASIGYQVVGENLAYITTDPAYIVKVLWQDPLHLSALLASDANVMGVSCVYDSGTAFWSYEPGVCSGGSCGTSMPTPTPTPAPTPGGDSTLDTEESAFLTLINDYRAQNALGPLQISAALQNAASWMANDMASKNYFSHSDSLGRSTGARLAAFGYNYSPTGENLAAGYSDARSAFDQWQSACDPDASGACTYAHRRIMLVPGFTAIGIARASGPSSAYGWYWATDFGSYLDQGAPSPTPSPTPGPTPSAAPIISAFTATPSSIATGQQSTLSWTVSGASSVTIDNGVGDVSDRTSKTVQPAATTTYTLTASNAAWTTRASVTLSVSSPTAPAPTPAPSISAFAATPSSIAAGQSATLSWNVTGASSIVIDNGVGDVTGSSSRAVRPLASTTYTLTASGAGGSTTSRVTVTVATAKDEQPPTAPTLSAATARSAAEVILTWTPGTDNVGVSAYQVLRNGAVLTTVSASILAYTDMAVTANATYSYSVRALDAAGNLSPASNSMQATTPAATVPAAGCPAAATGAFTGCYYPNTTMTGAPVLVRTDPQINFSWGGNSPDRVIPRGPFSARWEGTFDFVEGPYTFSAVTSDGMRIYVDGKIILDRWFDQAANANSVSQTLSAGSHRITVEYYELTGWAFAIVSWQRAATAIQLPSILSLSASPSGIAAGASSTLSWSVNGASSLIIDNGVGDVSGATSKLVSPNQTTTYTLTATNSAGSSTARVTVTVGEATDTQPPTAPTLLSATAKSPNQVDLAWSASADNVGVAGYQVLRNGTAVQTLGASTLALADTGVTPGATYLYAIRAYDRAGNYSTASNSLQVTAPSSPMTSEPCVTPGVRAFTGCYFSNTTLSGVPTLVRTDAQINFDWGGNPPDRSVNRGGYSVRWLGAFTFAGGDHTFSTLTSDGVRLYIDGELVLDKWNDQAATQHTVVRSMTAGEHVIKVEYYEYTGWSTAHVSWIRN